MRVSKLPAALLKSRALILSACLLSSLASVTQAHAATACPADALGTARTLSVGTKGGFAVGFKSYPQSLDLQDHEVVLTFDDGPSPATTPLVLDALAAQCVKATFFLIGRNTAAHPELVRREIADGHDLGNHTFSHPTLRLLSEAAARADIDKGFAAVTKAAASAADPAPTIAFFRFPGFAGTPALKGWLESRNIGIFGADLWASDWLPMTPDEELQRVLDRLDKEGRGILLLHDTKRATALMLPKLLVALKQRGFHIVHVVPDETAAPHLRDAPPGWTSATEAILAKLIPHLEKRRERGAKFDAGLKSNRPQSSL